MHTLKGFVRNKARPEGSIAEAYIANECLNFCSLYLRDVETRFTRIDRNYNGNQNDVEGKFEIFTQNARPIGATIFTSLSDLELEKVQWFVLNNSNDVDEYTR